MDDEQSVHPTFAYPDARVGLNRRPRLSVRALRRSGIEAARPYESTLPEAENTLKRLRERQLEAQAADQALTEIDAASGPLATAEKLAEQGFGPRLKSTADDVLARLNAKRTQPAGTTVVLLVAMEPHPME